ncbi:glycosyltransferase [uncultured Brevundimonas sp.]|uniref:glycosyltransferase n=1 Tax=uncultured Brevundimonas sp. TaxID=213418 RepID=UPI0030EEEE59|tara:strand:- start:48998 stop:50260 length:1263 start_codon:yes stop_codon:yes gene_type:complete
MLIWTIHLGEQLPIDAKPRLFRNGLLAAAAAALGHRVVQWAPTFSHLEKIFRSRGDALVDVRPNHRIQLFEAGAYVRNISVDRAVFHRTAARRFEVIAEGLETPDVIFCALPTPEMCASVLRFSRRHPTVKVVVDVQDLWPDVYLTALPRSLRSLAKPLLTPLYRDVRRTLEQADGLTAVSESYLTWAAAMAPSASSPAAAFALGYEAVQPLALNNAGPELSEIVEDMRSVSLPLCYVGQFSHFYDLETAIRACRKLELGGLTDFRLVLCGGGRDEQRLKTLAEGLQTVRFAGWLGAAELATIMSSSSMGLVSYSTDAPQSLPNKPFEYMAYGLGLVSNLKGELAQIISRTGCGFPFESDNVNELAAIILNLTSNPDAVQQARTASAALFETHYDAKVIYPRLVDFLGSLTTSPVPADSV